MKKLTLIGHIGGDAIVNDYNGKKIINFSLAHTEKFKDKDGVEVNKTTWFNCAICKEQGSSVAIANFLKKGTQVYLEGNVDIEQFTTKDNKPGAKFKVKVSQINLLGEAKKDQAETPVNSGTPETPVPPSAEAPY